MVCQKTSSWISAGRFDTFYQDSRNLIVNLRTSEKQWSTNFIHIFFEHQISFCEDENILKLLVDREKNSNKNISPYISHGKQFFYQWFPFPPHAVFPHKLIPIERALVTVKRANWVLDKISSILSTHMKIFEKKHAARGDIGSWEDYHRARRMSDDVINICKINILMKMKIFYIICIALIKGYKKDPTQKFRISVRGGAGAFQKFELLQILQIGNFRTQLFLSYFSSSFNFIKNFWNLLNFFLFTCNKNVYVLVCKFV